MRTLLIAMTELVAAMELTRRAVSSSSSFVYARSFMTTRGLFVKHRNLAPVLVLTALLTLSTATTASAQVCASLTLTSQAQVEPPTVQFGQVVADYGVDLNGNGRFDQLVVDAQQIVAGVRPQDLRDSQNLRQHVATELSRVQSVLDGLLVDRPRRNILRRPK